MALGLLERGDWRQDDPSRTKDGRFLRPPTTYRNFVTADGSPGPSGESGFPAEAGRYHLYVSLACPWAHRTLIFRKLKKLEDVISVSVVEPVLGKLGWEFGTGPGATLDTVNGKSTLAEIYLLTNSRYSGRVTVPVLWDKKRRTIVNNESSEIIRMLNSAFDAFTDVHTDYYPAELRAEIDRINDIVYPNVNNGVYRAGFATTQAAYEEAARALFATLDQLEERLSRQRYLVGRQVTEAVTEADGGCSPRSFASTPSITATSNAICGASPTIQIFGIICAICIRCRASPIPSASITSSGTTTAATSTSTRRASCRSGRCSTSRCRTTAIDSAEHRPRRRVT